MKILLGSLLGITAAVASSETYIGLNTLLNTPGLNVNAGYMFNPYIGAEGEFTFIPGNNIINVFGNSNSGSYYMFDAAAKGVLPLSSIFSLYGKLGLGINKYSPEWSGCSGCTSSYGSNYGILVGAGAQFNLSKSWSLHVEDSVVMGGNPNILMVGGQFMF